MNLLFLTVVFPLLGFLILAFSAGRLTENISAVIGVGSVGLSALIAAYVGYDFISVYPEGGIYTQSLWQWLSVGDLNVNLSLYLDGLSLTMLSVVTGVGFLIHLFASWYMRGEEGFSRFFAYTNLFIASMLFLVLGNDLLFVYLGWEGVGLCSYLLIGFYYQHSKNGAAALKAFVVTRVGDVFLAIGLFILYQQLGTLNIHEIVTLAPQKLEQGGWPITLATLMLLGGAVGKSAQLPLQTWLADAMAGPTPVSALIHAATMVTAGVYLITRTHELFLLAPDVLYLVGIIGAVTLLLAGFAALVQTDIKRILAYSTMSQIGYMFLALGVMAWDAAIFHLMTHAFFKALLFLSAGAVIVACHHEQNIYKMGGLRKSLPFIYACFLVGGAALSALPFITAGFYSKDEILWQALASNHIGLLLAGLVGALLTSIYTFRLIFIVFHGPTSIDAHSGKGVSYYLPLGILMLLSTFIGALITPPLAGVLPINETVSDFSAKHQLELISALVALVGIVIAATLFLGDRHRVNKMAHSAIGQKLAVLWLNAWGFDWLYDHIFVKPYLLVTQKLQADPLNRVLNIFMLVTRQGNKLVVSTETGQLRWYVTSVGFGALFILALLVLF
ncbi:MAG: NADH-quinone oxidoreductase subunit L [Plesiomonas sp.]